MNKYKSDLPKSRAWWRHHLSAREISQAENKNWIVGIKFSVDKQNAWYRYTFYRKEKKNAILFCFLQWIGTQLSIEEEVNNGGDKTRRKAS